MGFSKHILSGLETQTMNALVRPILLLIPSPLQTKPHILM
jgi:hypothetical protein